MPSYTLTTRTAATEASDIYADKDEALLRAYQLSVPTLQKHFLGLEPGVIKSVRVRDTESGELLSHWEETGQPHNSEEFSETMELMDKLGKSLGLQNITISSDAVQSARSLQKAVAGKGVDTVLVKSRSFGEIMVTSPDGPPTLGQVLQAIDAATTGDHIFFETYSISGRHNPKKGKYLTLNVFMGS
jgi:hypothetical protein